ncbi:hypothetical protein [Neisseria musculi]|uniref:hypothetical protein n=1 Tax=Neisseria musculi TaxID=1815583 RepID=UPI00164B3422|nr:hypothetical protein [Neisseria musculi]
MAAIHAASVKHGYRIHLNMVVLQTAVVNIDSTLSVHSEAAVLSVHVKPKHAALVNCPQKSGSISQYGAVFYGKSIQTDSN